MLASQGLIGTNNLILSLISSFVRITKITTMAMLLLLSESSGVKFYNWPMVKILNLHKFITFTASNKCVLLNFKCVQQ